MTVILLILSYLFLSIIQLTLSDVYVYNNENKLVEDYDDQSANFGPSFSSKGLKGFVTLTNPINACTRVASPPNISIPDFVWIALISRTNANDMCDFDLKVQNAQSANFSAVIIYNFNDGTLKMSPHGRDILIPSTLISHADGLSLISNYIYNQTSMNLTPIFHLKITSEQLFDFRSYIIPFFSIIGVSFLILIVFMLVKCYLQRRHTRRHRLPRSALKQLKIKKFVKGDRWEVCAICLDDYEDGAKLRILPCDHAYHMKCIDPWLLNNRRQCPVCKRYVFPNQDNSDEEEQRTTERTPLIQPTDDNPVAALSRNRRIERRIINPSGTGASNISFAINESSETEDDDASSSPRPTTTTNNITTTGLIFDKSSSNSQRYSHLQLPCVVLHESSPVDLDQNNITTTTYGSLRDSPSTSFTTPRAANFFVGSLSGTTDNTNISARSVIEDDSDTDDNDDRMHSVLSDVEINQGYVLDEGTTNILRTNL